MSSCHRHRPIGPSYRELIATGEESAGDLIDYQMKRDQERFSYEKQKLALLILIVLSLWVMFFVFWEKLDDARPLDPAPAIDRHSVPSFPEPHYEQLIAIHYA